MSILTVKCKLDPTPEQRESLDRTLVAFAEGCNFALRIGRENGTTSKVKIQMLGYHELRVATGLSANLAIRAINRAAGILKVITAAAAPASPGCAWLPMAPTMKTWRPCANALPPTCKHAAAASLLSTRMRDATSARTRPARCCGFAGMLTSVVAMLPLIVFPDDGDFWMGLAVTVVGGLLASTLLAPVATVALLSTKSFKVLFPVLRR